MRLYLANRYNIIQPHRSQGDWAPDVCVIVLDLRHRPHRAQIRD